MQNDVFQNEDDKGIKMMKIYNNIEYEKEESGVQPLANRAESPGFVPFKLLYFLTSISICRKFSCLPKLGVMSYTH